MPRQLLLMQAVKPVMGKYYREPAKSPGPIPPTCWSRWCAPSARPLRGGLRRHRLLQARPELRRRAPRGREVSALRRARRSDRLRVARPKLSAPRAPRPRSERAAARSP